MASKPKRNDLADAVRALREHLGESQMEFAKRMGWHIVTLARYETSRAPKGRQLADLHRLARGLAAEVEDTLSMRIPYLQAKQNSRNREAVDLEADWDEVQRMELELEKLSRIAGVFESALDRDLGSEPDNSDSVTYRIPVRWQAAIEVFIGILALPNDRDHEAVMKILKPRMEMQERGWDAFAKLIIDEQGKALLKKQRGEIAKGEEESE